MTRMLYVQSGNGSNWWPIQIGHQTPKLRYKASCWHGSDRLLFSCFSYLPDNVSLWFCVPAAPDSSPFLPGSTCLLKFWSLYFYMCMLCQPCWLRLDITRNNTRHCRAEAIVYLWFCRIFINILWFWIYKKQMYWSASTVPLLELQ